jgi:hypothetical protein
MKRAEHKNHTHRTKKTSRPFLRIAALLLGAASLSAQVLAPPPEKPATGSPDLVHDDISTLSLKPKFGEDWSTPSLKSSGLVPQDPLVGEVDENDKDYSLEVIQVQWRPADPIYLYVMKPAGVSKPPVVLYLFDYPTDNARYHNPEFRRLLTKDGVAAVGFVGALTGDRFHAPRGLTEWFVGDLKESLATSSHDVQMILNYLEKRGDFDMSRAGMYGEGSGASIAILAAAVDPRIKTLDLVDPWGDWPDWLAKSSVVPEKERAGLLTKDFLDGVAPLDPLKWLPELKTQKVRIREIENLPSTPPEARQKIAAAVPGNVELYRFKDHKIFAGSIADGAAFDWIKHEMGTGQRKDKEYRADDHSQGKTSPNSTKD